MVFPKINVEMVNNRRVRPHFYGLRARPLRISGRISSRVNPEKSVLVNPGISAPLHIQAL